MCAAKLRKYFFILPFTVFILIYIFYNYRCETPKIEEKLAHGENDFLKPIQVGKLFFVLNSTTNVYEIDKKPIIWLYWNDPYFMPAFVKILIELIGCVNPKFITIVVNNKTIGDFWPQYPKNIFSKLIPAHQSDVFRVHILQRFGGVYLDLDTFPISSMTPFYEALSNHHLIGSNWRPTESELSVGHLGPVRANLSMLKIWAFWQEKILEEKLPNLNASSLLHTTYPFHWAELLSSISTILMNHTLKHNLIRYFQLDGLRTVGQLVSFKLADDVTMEINATIYERLKLLKPTPLLYFHNSKQPKHLLEMTTEQLFKSKKLTLFSYFVKCATKRCHFFNSTTKERKLTDLDFPYMKRTFFEISRNFSAYPCIL